MRQNQWNITVTVDGTKLGTFEAFSGGEVDSEETTYFLGAMGPRISLGGSQSVGNVTVGVLYDLAAIHSQYHWLAQRAGKASMEVAKQPLDTDGNAYGRPAVYRGRLKQVNGPEVDAQSSDAAVLELEMTVSGTVV